MADEERDLLGGLPRSRPGVRSARRATGATAKPRSSKPPSPGARTSAPPPAPPQHPPGAAEEAVRLAAGAAGTAFGVASGVTRGILRRLPRP